METPPRNVRVSRSYRRAFKTEGERLSTLSSTTLTDTTSNRILMLTEAAEAMAEVAEEVSGVEAHIVTVEDSEVTGNLIASNTKNQDSVDRVITANSNT